MDMKNILDFNNFVVVGDTLNVNKYAYKIKKELLNNNYNVCGVGKELASINEVGFDIDVLDLCINPSLGIKLLKENNKKIKIVVIQPGAQSDEIKTFLNENKICYVEDCLFAGLKLYKNIGEYND